MDPGILKSRFARNRAWKNWEVYFIFCRPFVKDKPFLPLRGKLGLGPGMAARFAKAPAGILAFIGETKGFPQREAEGLRPASFRGKTTAS